MSGTGTKRSFMGAKASMRLRSALYGMLMGLLIPVMAAGPVLAQTATLLPDAKQQYFDDAGNPVALGRVDYYVPSTTTRKTVWQDANKTTPQTNGVVLDAAGRPQPTGQTYGDGLYRQKVLDVNGNTIWDAVTSSTGTGGGGAVASTEGVMVGTILPWANTTLPAKYLYTGGQAINRVTYAQLFTALTFNVTVLCSIGIATIAVPTDVSDRVPVGAKVELSCFAPGTTVLSKSSGLLTLSTNATATASVNGNIFPWGNGDGAMTFNVPNIAGRTIVGRNNMPAGVASGVLSSTYYTDCASLGVNPNAINALAGCQSQTLTLGQLPTGINSTVTVSSVTVSPAASGVLLVGGSGTGFGVSTFSSTGGGAQVWQAFNPGSILSQVFSISGTGSGTSVSNNTSGSPHTIMSPSVTADYIIKALPDDSPTGPGVSSIGGMTGAISCGSGIFCTANTISTAPAGVVNTWALFSTGVGTTPAYRAITGADLPNPSTVSLGGIFAKPQVAGQVIGGIDNSGNLQLVTNGTFPTADAFGLAVGRLGATNPALQVDSSQALQDTGVKITGQAGVNGVNVAAIGANANVPLIVDAKGTGTINFGVNSTGQIITFRNVLGFPGQSTINGDMAANSIKCNNTGSVATSIDCTKAQLQGITKGVWVLAASAVQAPLTGSTTETTLATIATPGNTLGANGVLRITAQFSYTSVAAGNWTPRVKFGGTAYFDNVNTSAGLSQRLQAQIANRNATNSQVGNGIGQVNWSSSTTALVTSAVDTTVSQNILITGQLANAADTMRLESYTVEVMVP